MPDSASHSTRQPFIPAKPTGWFIKAAQAFVRAELALTNRLYLEQEDLEAFRQLPPGSGIVLISNHADETDPRVCLEVSRRSARRFITMCNREAFDEIRGLAGWALQRLGLFSVERGVHDHQARSYATDVVKQGRDVLVIFPEGEIFYTNEMVHPFHSGAIDICLQAIVEKRKHAPDWTAYIVPMVIKYHYNKPIEAKLDERITRIETHLSLRATGDSFQTRLAAIQRKLLEQVGLTHHVATEALAQQQLTREIIATKKAILSEVEERHQDMPVSEQARTIDQAWQLGAEIRRSLDDESDQNVRKELQRDLAMLTDVAELSSWRPHYYMENASTDRLAEVVLKIERQLYNIKRPRQLESRNVLVKISEPIDMGLHVDEYTQDPHAVRHRVTEQLHVQIQALVNSLILRSGKQ